jgi:HEAT repeats
MRVGLRASGPAILLLVLIVFSVAVADPLKESDEPKDKAAAKEAPADPIAGYEKLLNDAGIKLDPEALLSFFRSRTLSDEARARLLTTIRRLGDDDFDVREAASEELTRAGLAALPILRAASRSQDEEVSSRIERCLEQISQENETARIIAAAHLLAHKKAEGTAATLLNYLPNVPDDEAVADGIRSALVSLCKNVGKADSHLVAALSDKDPLRRALAAQVLGEALPEQRPAVQKLLTDPDPKVRLVAGVTLLKAGDRGVMPELLKLLTDGPVEYAYQVEDVLCQLIGDGKAPATLSGGDEGVRKKCRTAWEQWWAENGAEADLAKLTGGEPLKGLTLVIEVDGVGGPGGQGRVWECGPDGKQRWEWLNVNGPVDIQVLPGGRFLVAEYYASRVTERDREGKIIWESPRLTGNTVSAQRLPSGNTLIATMNEVTEVSRDGKRAVASFPRPQGTVFQARRAKSGHTFILAGNELWELDVGNKPIRKIPVGGLSGWGGFDFLPNGNFLICYYTSARKYAEIDGNGKAVWEHTTTAEPSRIQRLRNGNILIAGGNAHFVAEYDRDKKEVWKVATKGRPFSVLRY